MKWHFTSEAYEQLNKLIQIVSPSAFENAMSAYLSEEWEKKGLCIDTDVLGNLYAHYTGGGEKHVAIVAHMDTVMMQITHILPNGMLQFRSGGMNPMLQLGQQVVILGEDGIIPGVIGYDPTSQYTKGVTEEDLWIDIGDNSRENAQKFISVGNPVVFAPRLMPLMDRYLCGTSIDDRIGLFILQQCLDQLIREEVPVNLHFVGTTQEEIALRGATVLAHHLPKLDACIVLDVDYATDTPSGHANQMGALSLGEGIGFNVRSDNNPGLLKLSRSIADETGIPYQLTVGRFPRGGTDSSVIQLQQGGVATLNVNIPCRYMHSPVEMCHIQDVENAVILIVKLIDAILNKE